MPSARFEIEETASDRWIGECDVGFPVCRRQNFLERTFEEVIASVSAWYRQMVPLPKDDIQHPIRVPDDGVVIDVEPPPVVVLPSQAEGVAREVIAEPQAPETEMVDPMPAPVAPKRRGRPKKGDTVVG